MALGPLCLDLAREALKGYVHPPSEEAQIAARIRIGVEDDLEDLVRDGRIVKREVAHEKAVTTQGPPAPAPGSALHLGERGEAGAATTMQVPPVRSRHVSPSHVVPAGRLDEESRSSEGIS